MSDHTDSTGKAAGPERQVALRFVILLGIVSLFADMTYEGSAKHHRALPRRSARADSPWV